MERLILKDKEFIIRNFYEDDIYKPKKLLSFIDNMIDDSDAMITLRVRKTTEQEKEWFMDMLSAIRNSRMAMLIAEFNDRIVGGAEISFCSECEEHIAEFNISIIKDYRSYGLGSYLLSRITDIAEKNLKPKPTIIKLSVFSNNEHAIALYQKYGFDIVSRIPNRFESNGRFVDEIIMLKFI
ncbi:MAG: GNAT family N-acetyltransferase [Patescibacteria group bacterium]